MPIVHSIYLLAQSSWANTAHVVDVNPTMRLIAPNSVDTWLSHCHPRFKLSQGMIAEGRVTAFPVIEHFDILEDLPPGFDPGGVVLIHELALERPEETFDALSQVHFATHTGGWSHTP